MAVSEEEKQRIEKIMEEDDALLRSLNGGTKKKIPA